MSRRIEPENGLMIALDLIDLEAMLNLAESIHRYVDAFKVGIYSIARLGSRVIEELSSLDLRPVIVDLKLADVPHINERVAECLRDSGASGLIVHGFVGEDSVRACMLEDLDVFVVCAMTNPGADEILGRFSEDLALLAKKIGTRGVVAPANKPPILRRIREIVGEDLLVISPGVGVQGGDLEEAIRSGADIAIVGRSIYSSPDPISRARRMSEIARRTLEERRKSRRKRQSS